MSDLDNIRAQILEAKEKRWEKQNDFLDQYKTPLIVFKMNIPSWPKMSSIILHVFLKALVEFTKKLIDSELDFRIVEINHSLVGPEAFLIAKTEAQAVKKLTIEFEEHHHIGRFFDVDVLDFSGEIIEREVKRRCFLCEEQAFVCMRNQTHSSEEIKNYFDEQISSYLEIKKQQ